MSDKREPNQFELVFPNGHPKHRPMLLGKHEAMHWTVWQKAIAKAERLDPWLSDFITWALWWKVLDEQRERWLLKDMHERLDELSQPKSGESPHA